MALITENPRRFPADMFREFTVGIHEIKTSAKSTESKIGEVPKTVIDGTVNAINTRTDAIDQQLNGIDSKIGGAVKSIKSGLEEKFNTALESINDLTTQIHKILEDIIKKQSQQELDIFTIDDSIIIGCIFPVYRELNRIEDGLMCRDFNSKSQKNTGKPDDLKVNESCAESSETIKNLANLKSVTTLQDRLQRLVEINKLRQSFLRDFIEKSRSSSAPPSGNSSASGVEP